MYEIERQNILDAIVLGLITMAEAKDRLKKLKQENVYN